MMWTEKAISEDLGSSFWQMQISYEGKLRVVDLNSAIRPPTNAPAPRWTQDELEQLVLMKRRGFSNLEISAELNRDMNGISQKWSQRDKWKDGVFIPRSEVLTMADITRAVCNVFGVNKIDFASERRAKKVTEARQVFYWIARNYTPCSLPRIGDTAGGKDHSTVIYGIAKVDEQMDRFRSAIELCLFDLGLTEKTSVAA